MRTVTTTLAASALLLCSAVSVAQKKSTAENGLVGIKLYDSGTRVIQMYGTPDDIQPVNFGGSAIGPSGAGAGGGGGRAPLGGGGGGRGLAPSAAGTSWMNDMGTSFENEMLFRAQGQAVPNPEFTGGGGGGPAPAAGGGGGRGAASGGSSGSVVFTRWIYKRGGSRYGFIIDRGNRVVQIEAIGLFNKKVRTKKGAGFGSTFADLVKRYGAPDGYEIAGEQIVVRYLTRSKAAFRLSRLGPDKPHVVTGVVVAAGKA